MRSTTVLKAFGAGAFAATAATLVAERLMLRRVAATPAPQGWRNPTWPAGTQVMVPTDDGAELLVETTGPDDGRTVMLIHGLSGDHHSLGLVATGLAARGFRVIGLNQRGHGGSTVGTEGFGPARQGVDVGQVLAALDLHDVTLVGHSMGGLASMCLMTLRPETGAERVASLVLVATLAEAVRSDRQKGLQIGETNFYRGLAQHPVHGPALARAIFGRTPSRAMLDDVMAVGLRCPLETRIGAALGMIGYDIRDKLSHIDRPTTIVCGTRDLLTKPGENRDIAAAIPGATFVSVPDAGHMIIWEDPAAIIDAVSDLAGANRTSTNA